MAPNPKRLKLVAYIRVSTEAQVDGFGLEAQIEAIQRWAKARGHRVVQVCRDEGVSGTTDAFDREGLSCAIQGIEHDQADGVVVARLDRLARHLTVQEAVLAHLWHRGAQVFCADSGEVLPDDQEDPMRTAMRQMAGVFSQLDRAMIAKRLRDGRRVKAARGGYVAGSPPYGFRAEGGELVAVPAEQATLRRMVRLRKAGASLRSIADTLNAEGVTAKRGGPWAATTVSRAIDPAARERARQGAAKARSRQRAA